MARLQPLLALLLLLVYAASHRTCYVVALELSAPRIAIERRSTLRLRPAGGEPAFDKTVAARGCLLNRNDGQHGGGFKLTLPPHTRGEKESMSGLIMPSKLLVSGELECQVHKVITTGNTTISVASADRQNKVSGDPRWRAAHFEHYAARRCHWSRHVLHCYWSIERVVDSCTHRFGCMLRCALHHAQGHSRAIRLDGVIGAAA